MFQLIDLELDTYSSFLEIMIMNAFFLSETICISSKIKELTQWYFNHQTIEDVIIFFKTKYQTKNGMLDLCGLAGVYLRTLSPKDYFRVVEYERRMNIIFYLDS